MDYRKQAKEAMNSKISRMITPGKEKVDASDWSPSEPLDADIKTGMRPVSRRAYKKGGKVEAKPEGKMCGGRADRKKRQSGGKALTADSLINRNVKEANEDRDGKKHVGGMKAGGRAKKNVGGGMPYGGANYGIPQGQGAGLMRKMITGGFKKGGKVVKKADGGGMDKYGENEGGSAVEIVAPKVAAGKRDVDRAALNRAAMVRASNMDPYGDEEAPLITREGDYDPYTSYKRGGAAHDAHKAIGHAVGAAMRAYHDHEAAETPAHEAREERVAKAYGGGFGESMNNPKTKGVKMDKGKKSPTINIVINSGPKAPELPVPGGPLPLGAPPMPPPGMAGMAPGMSGPPGGAPGGAPQIPPGALAALAGAMGGGAGAGPAPMPRKAGGRTMTAGAGSGEGRLEKADWYGARPGRATGGKLGMTAGAGSGEGRLEKIAAYGKKS